MTNAYQQFNKELKLKYDELNLKQLKEILFDEKRHHDFLIEVVRRKTAFQRIPFFDYKMAYEMDFITADIKYITGMLFFLRPGIDKPLQDGRNFQSIEDRRYLMHVTFGLQAIYNFWDRIGDLLWLFFSTNLSERDVYFDRVINSIRAPYNSSTYYISLFEIYNNQVKPIFSLGKKLFTTFSQKLNIFGPILKIIVKQLLNQGFRKNSVMLI